MLAVRVFACAHMCACAHIYVAMHMHVDMNVAGTTLAPSAHLKLAAQDIKGEVFDSGEGAHDGDDARSTEKCRPIRPISK